MQIFLLAEPNDAFWLAQAHFLMGHYSRAEVLLTGPLPASHMPNLAPKEIEPEHLLDTVETPARPPLGNPRKGKGRASTGGMSDFSMIAPAETNGKIDSRDAGYAEEHDHSWIQDLMKNTKGGLWGALKEANGMDNERIEDQFERLTSKDRREPLSDWSMPCKYLAALCMVSVLVLSSLSKSVLLTLCGHRCIKNDSRTHSS